MEVVFTSRKTWEFFQIEFSNSHFFAPSLLVHMPNHIFGPSKAAGKNLEKIIEML